MKFKKYLSLDISTWYFVVGAGLLYLSVMILNDGFMALDEYWVGITRYIPAQTSTLHGLVSIDDVKSPLQMLPMFSVAQWAYQGLGVESPYWQYRAVIFALGSLSFVLTLLSFLKWSNLFSFERSDRNFLILMLCFYFAAPFSLTRPMYESIAAPWLALAAVWGTRYDQHEKRKDLLWAVFFVSMAFVLRQQLGFCAIGLLLIAVIKKRWSDLLAASFLGGVFFIAAGIPDYFLRGQFHYSLLNLTVYNYQHGADYGRQPITFYPVLIFAICLTPFFIKKYSSDFLKESFQQSRVLWIFLGLFVFLHSLFPQKWERFVISVIPLLLLIFYPFLRQLQSQFLKNRWRLLSLYSLNGLLFVVASFFPPQKNLIQMSLYLDQHPQVKQIYRLHDTPGWITEAFIKSRKIEWVESNPESLQNVDWTDCSKALVLGAFDLDSLQPITQKLQLLDRFDVNLIEQVAYRLNPKNNARRVQLSLFSGCKI